MRFLGSEPCCRSALSHGTHRRCLFYHTGGYGIKTLVFKGLLLIGLSSPCTATLVSALSAPNYPFSIIPRGEGEYSTSDTPRRDYILITVTVLP